MYTCSINIRWKKIILHVTLQAHTLYAAQYTVLYVCARSNSKCHVYYRRSNYSTSNILYFFPPPHRRPVNKRMCIGCCREHFLLQQALRCT